MTRPTNKSALKRYWMLVNLGSDRWRGVMISHLDYTDVVTAIGSHFAVVETMKHGSHVGLPILPDPSQERYRRVWNGEGLRPCLRESGTLHVYGDRVAGYIISHEFRSGDSWGDQRTFSDAAEAIAAAYAMNRDDYAGDCDVYVAAHVIEDANPGVGAVNLPNREDF